MPKPIAPSQDTQTLHATTVAVAGRGVLILGPAGSGKSSLALRLISFGAQLVSDDRTIVTREGSQVIASAPETIRGKIEARGVGILTAPTAENAPLALVVDMASVNNARIPDPIERDILGVGLPCLQKVEQPHFPDAVLLYLRGCIHPSA